LTALRDKDAARFDKAALFVARIPEVEGATKLDEQVGAAIDDQLSRANADVHGPYLSYYKTLVESVEDEVAESIAEQIAGSSPRVERFVRETIVTFGTFFRLHGDIQEEIVGGMSNKDLGALVASLRDDWRTQIFVHVEARRKELVEDEAKRLIARGPRQASAAHRAAKRAVVDRIIQAKGGGSLAALLAAKPEGLSATAGNTSDAA
jgi:hypothetical protein